MDEAVGDLEAGVALRGRGAHGPRGGAPAERQVSPASARPWRGPSWTGPRPGQARADRVGPDPGLRPRRAPGEAGPADSVLGNAPVPSPSPAIPLPGQALGTMGPEVLAAAVSTGAGRSGGADTAAGAAEGLGPSWGGSERGGRGLRADPSPGNTSGAPSCGRSFLPRPRLAAVSQLWGWHLAAVPAC